MSKEKFKHQITYIPKRLASRSWIWACCNLFLLNYLLSRIVDLHAQNRVVSPVVFYLVDKNYLNLIDRADCKCVSLDNSCVN